jgi:hypothetical protein
VRETTPLNDAELKELFDRLFPHGFAGADVLAEIAPNGWTDSPLLACFHPSPEQVFRELLQSHQHIESLRRMRRNREPHSSEYAPSPAPTMEEVRCQWEDPPLNVSEETTDVVALCLWDIFADNHEVIAMDGRVADIGSFRGASAFLDEHLSGSNRPLMCGDEYRFYLGTIWISQRADLTSVYRMIFKRIKAVGADWEYHFPRLHIFDLSPLSKSLEKPETYSPSAAFAQQQEERELEVELEKSRAELDEIHQQSCREAMDRPPPAIVRAYQEIYGRDPKGWPPL